MERYIGAELRRLSNLSCRYFERQAGKRQTEAITGTNGWIIGYIGRREERGEVVYQHDLESRFGAASKDITEMIGSGFNPEHTHVLIMAGGSRHWITGFDRGPVRVIQKERIKKFPEIKNRSKA